MVKRNFPGIIIPDNLKDPEKPNEIQSFRVIAKGPECKHTKIGDTIVPYFNPVMAHRHDNETIFFFKEEFVALVGKEEVDE